MSEVVDTAISQLSDLIKQFDALPLMQGAWSNYRSDDVLARRLTACVQRWQELVPGFSGVAASIKSGPTETLTDSAGEAAKALLGELQEGSTRNVSQLFHADTFADFLEMADHLLSEGYKDASAVITGSTLEQHLRELCKANDIETEAPNPNGPQAKKADTMNSELAKADVYGKLEQKSVTAWLNIRNDAAHGHYEKYDAKQVRFMLDQVRHFISKYPA